MITFEISAASLTDAILVSQSSIRFALPSFYPLLFPIVQIFRHKFVVLISLSISPLGDLPLPRIIIHSSFPILATPSKSQLHRLAVRDCAVLSIVPFVS